MASKMASKNTLKNGSKKTVIEGMGVDAINILPDELLLYIFKLLPLDDILACENVCERWKKLTRDVTLWKNITIVYAGRSCQCEINTRNLDLIQTHCENIHCLKLQYVFNYPILINILQKCENLISLELVMCKIPKEFEVDVARWPNLKKLSLKNSILGTTADLTIQYDQFRCLNFLCLSEFGLNSANSDSLISCKYLSHIYIEKIRSLDLDYIMKLIVAKQNILESLHIYGLHAVNNECLKLLSHCPMLKDLAIIRCENLNDEGLIALTNLKSLQHLQIWNNLNFTETNLFRALGSPTMKTLQSLSFSRIGNISPLIVDVISEYYKNLKFLALYECPRIINTDYEKQLKSKFRNIDVVLY